MKLHHLIIAVGAFAGTTMQAEGLLGQNYFQGSLGISTTDVNHMDLDTKTAAIGYNASVFKNAQQGFDLNFGLAYTTDSEDYIDMDVYQLKVGGAWYYNEMDRVRPFVGAGVGYAWVDESYSDDSFLWSIGIGLELEPADNFTLTPSIFYVDAADIDGAEEFQYGIEAAYWFTPGFNLGLAYTYTDAEYDVTGDSFTVTARFRF